MKHDMKTAAAAVLGFGAAMIAAAPAWAQDVAAPAVAPVVAPVVATVNKGDTAWMMTSTLLVLMMIVPGLALF